MDWVKLHVLYYADERIERLPDADTELMFVRGLARAGELGRGGFIPESSLPRLARRRRYVVCVEALVAEGLWTRVDGGYQITNWSDWQDALDALAARRATDRERKRRQRAAEKPMSRDNRETSRDMSRDVTPPRERGKRESSVTDVTGDIAPRSSDDSTPDSTQTLVAEWIDHCRRRPPGNVIGQVAKQLKGLLAEGFDYDDVRAGLALWHSKGLHPSTLPSVVNEHINAVPNIDRRQAQTDQMFDRAMARAQEREAAR